MTPLPFASFAALVVGAGYLLAAEQNAKGRPWAGLISGILAVSTLGIAAVALLATDFGPAAFCIALPVSVRIALELGFSFSEIIRPKAGPQSR